MNEARPLEATRVATADMGPTRPRKLSRARHSAYNRPVITLLYRLVRNLLMAVLWPFWALLRHLGRPKSDAIVLKLRRRLVAIETPRRWFADLVRSAQGADSVTSLTDVRALVDQVVADPDIRFFVVHLPPLQTGWAGASGLRRELERVKAANKTVVVWLPEGGGNKELWIATAANSIYLSPQATFGPLGIAARVNYLKDLLEKVGVGVEVEARKEYKTAAETTQRTKMSPAQREQLGALLSGIHGALRAGLAEHCDDPDGFLDRVLVRGDDAVSLGLAAGVCYEDELCERVTGRRPGGKTPGFDDAWDYLDYHDADYFLPLRRAPYIAVVRVDGAIVSVPPRFRSPGSEVAAQQAIMGALRKAGRDRRALGVVLHVNSPGGSALASDLIHREVVMVQKHKPVVACFADVAASGGYYVAAPASVIVAEALTVTGSIGVVMAKVVAAALQERLGIRTDTIRLNPHADLLSPSRALDEAERAILAREADSFYASFVQIVADGRKRPFDDVEPLARGRVWSGTDALDRGLIDAIGGLDVARARVLELVESSEKSRARMRGEMPLVAVLPPRGALPNPLQLPDPAKAVLERVAPELNALAELTGGRDTALYYAHGLPQID